MTRIQVIELTDKQQGKSQQNGFARCFNGAMRQEFLNVYLFKSISQAGEIAWRWRQITSANDFMKVWDICRPGNSSRN